MNFQKPKSVPQSNLGSQYQTPHAGSKLSQIVKKAKKVAKY